MTISRLLLAFLVSVSVSLAAPRPAYETESWPAARTLTWAKPGTSGAFAEAANWLEQGQPASAAPDRTTDVVLPAAAQNYSVTAPPNAEVRHLTVDRNAYIEAKHRNDLQVWGNIWVKDGGRLQFVACRGPKHTFFRVDAAEFPTPENNLTFLGGVKGRSDKPQSRARVSHKFEIAKYGDASVELIGNIGVGDEIMVQHGRCIVSGDLRWSGVTDKGALEVFDGAILELQSGGAVGPFISTNAKHVYNINLYRGATLRAGSPERPLTSDAHVFLGYGPNKAPGDTGLYAAAGSVIRVHSANPKTARLVFTALTGQPNRYDGKGAPVSAPERAAQGTDGLVLRLAGDVDLRGAHFDYVSENGVRLARPEARARWTDVTFGSHNAGPPDRLFGAFDVDANVYYHNRGDGESEFALTTKATKSMADYMKKSDPYQLKVSPEAVTTGRDGAKFDKPLSIVFEQPIEVTIATKHAAAAIHYTTDGSDVTAASPRYTAPIRLDRTTRLNVRAFAPGIAPSAPLTVSYVFGKK
ncbi:MAG: chitobiase/beta-hexosaminidase C-terminal domain-containing protein [Opitutaceae bacterium]|nr:chitobiase/beta-hexosaminidase C-terminal domain-containing protein [Opitutaceae bacterium]